MSNQIVLKSFADLALVLRLEEAPQQDQVNRLEKARIDEFFQILGHCPRLRIYGNRSLCVLTRQNRKSRDLRAAVRRDWDGRGHS